MFRVGDEVVCVNTAPIGHAGPANLEALALLSLRSVYTVEEIDGDAIHLVGVRRVYAPDLEMTPPYKASRFRKVERRNDSLSIEAFLTIKPGFEEPRRTNQPAKRKEQA